MNINEKHIMKYRERKTMDSAAKRELHLRNSTAKNATNTWCGGGKQKMDWTRTGLQRKHETR
jgi:hypothetical protein